MTDAQESFVVEYPCDLHCRVEIDLADHHARVTHRQMRDWAEVEHKARHEPKPPEVATPIHDWLTAAFRGP